MSVIGEAALTAFFDGLFTKLSSSDTLNLVSEKQVRKELNKWQTLLRDIRAVLDDAEQKQLKDRFVNNWLADLQHLAYDVDDILDHFATEAALPRINKVRNLIPTHFSPKALIFNAKMMSKVKDISVRMNDLATRRTQLELREGVSVTVSSTRLKQRVQPTSLVDETHVFGRQKERDSMLELLLRDVGSELTVIPIVGMGGIGKTTLAQLVYNADGINGFFDLKAWVCVSEDFDAVAITKTVLQSIAASDCCANVDDLNLLQVKLKEELEGKKLLLVLDDVWNENYEDLTILLSPFGAGTKILVTTRSLNVSSIMSTVENNPLRKLSEEDSLCIFAQHALKARDFSRHPELKEAGEKIVKKCNGLPLAAKAIGGLLRTTLDPHVWDEISKSEIWDLPEEKCGIVPALRLSYHHLPPHLKRCFAYCAILPKDCKFGEEEITLLWQAEGFLQRASSNTQIEHLGSQYFQELVSRSFFQASIQASIGDKSQFVMHDLVNDLAQLVAGEICSKAEDNKQLKISKRTRHSSYVRGEYDGLKKFEALDQAKHLRTFLSFQRRYRSSGYCYLSNDVLIDLLPKFRCLRVPSLKWYHIIELPNHFKELRHLRYLDLSHTAIASLPDSICTLYNLETLLLFECVNLEKLPSNLQDLVNLRFLDITGAISLKGMPFGINKLANLQKLSNFVLGKGEGHRIQEVKNLINLKGKLSISGLENIVEAHEAREAKLIDKSGLDILKLKWSTEFDNNRSKEVEEEVLHFLEPPKKLEDLLILNYGGTKFPIWMNFSLETLSALVLNNCKNCVSLPTVGQLPLLKTLFIAGMDELNKVGIEFYGENQLNAFPSLQRLCFKDMPRWREWDLVDEHVMKFPSLTELMLINCPQLLGTLPKHLHSLKKLAISGCTQLVASLSDLPLLCELSINECAELVLEDADFLSMEIVFLSKVLKISTPKEWLVSRSTSAALEYCKIFGCTGLTYSLLKELGLLGHERSGSLRKLDIVNCPKLVLLEPDEAEEAEEELLQVRKQCNIESLRIRKQGLNIQSLTIRKHFLAFLTEMDIQNCPNVVSFATNSLPPVLKSLTIQDCMNFRCLLDEGENINVGSTCRLEHLEIRLCPSLVSLSLPDSLQHLILRDCSKLVSLSESGKLPGGLKKLKLFSCPELQSIVQAIEVNACLESIYIGWCGIQSLPQGLDSLKHLGNIDIRGCKNLVSLAGFLPSTNLTELSIYQCESLRALPNCMHKLTSLQALEVQNDSGDEISIPEEGLSTNLMSLEISVPRNIESVLEWGLHRLTSLQTLRISGLGCPNMVSFPPEETGMMLPPSLTDLTIQNFKNLQILSSKGFQNLTPLRYLFLFSCPKLRSLPRKDTLLSLVRLAIDYCPLLKEECKRDKGRQWPKISHIPCVTFHEED